MLRRSILNVAVFSLISLVGCGDLSGPDALEPVQLTTSARQFQPGEVIPSAEVSAATGGIHVRVSAGQFCAMIAEAAVVRAPGRLWLVGRASSNPAALCVQGGMWVSVYEGTIPVSRDGVYEIRVLQAVGDGDPTLVGTYTIRT